MSSKMKNVKIDDFHVMTVKNVFWGITGLILGLIINDIVIFVSNTFKIKYLLLQNFIQITLCAMLLAVIHTNNLYGWSWQHLIPELFFISFFFGVQYKILSNLQHSYVIHSDNSDNTTNSI
uniref:Uncharacterized protein n=1 Tax=viral metagenome TaxID=1070528 RepID=A0A6C0F037_9ZZZZ